MKSAPQHKWIKRFFYVLILLGLGCGYFVERSSRLDAEEKIRKLVIVHDSELGEYNNILIDMTSRQIKQSNEMLNMRAVLMQYQRTVYEMYNELRKYNKKLPPWGGEKPLEDKWTSNDI
ncbi:MAG: hypothetical protein CMA30_02575 [Euryarchaeota archaeon]|nr:hypothetical protein [Euryarchaeota archaeon]